MLRILYCGHSDSCRSALTAMSTMLTVLCNGKLEPSHGDDLSLKHCAPSLCASTEEHNATLLVVKPSLNYLR